MAAPLPGNRRDRRNLTAALAKQILQDGRATRERISTGDWILFCLAGAMGLLVFVIDKTPASVAVVLVLMFGLLIVPVLHVPWVRRGTENNKRYLRSTIALLLAAGLVSGFGYTQWPKPKARHLGLGDMATMSYVLKAELHKQPVEIAAVANDNEAYNLAEQFVAVFTQAGWTVRPLPPPTLIAAGSIEDITVKYATLQDTSHITIENALKAVHLVAHSTYDPTLTNLGEDLAVEIGKYETK
jgi:hypothetical protein